MPCWQAFTITITKANQLRKKSGMIDLKYKVVTMCPLHAASVGRKKLLSLAIELVACFDRITPIMIALTVTMTGKMMNTNTLNEL